jgi:hypothetical protein
MTDFSVDPPVFEAPGSLASPTREAAVAGVATEAQDLIAHTYYGLRWGLAGLAFVFPIVLYVGGSWFRHQDLPTSISGYYHTGMRNYFVATLVAIGLFLLLYKGFSKGENRLLNVAGICVLALTFLPTARDHGATDPAVTFTSPHPHGLFAAAAFAAIGLVAIAFGPRTLDRVPEGAEAVIIDRGPLHWSIPVSRRAFALAYLTIGVAMIVLPALCWLVSRGDDSWLFLTETVALWVFCAYWLLKTIEFRASSLEKQAIAGEVDFPQQSVRGVRDDVQRLTRPSQSSTTGGQR